MPRMTLDDNEFLETAARSWWLFLITGIAWLWIAMIVLRLNLDTVYAISILFGFVAIGAGVNELMAVPMSTTGWKVARGILGVLCIAAGIVAFFRPEGTFVALAALVGWLILFKGIFDVLAAIIAHGLPLWWLTLLIGLAEIAIAFWAVGYFRGSAILLVVWVAAFALLRGITEILLAFRLRGARKQLHAATV
jgi:uncharacterized membrane protein HdeD (DUF308 family)